MTRSIEDIDFITRREIETRIVKPLLDRFALEFGQEITHQLASEVLEMLAQEAGQELADRAGGTSMRDLASALEPFSDDEANDLEVLELNDDTYAFNMTRCKYAEMYKKLGMPELGLILSYSRDFELCQGFNSDITLTRTQTIMEGAEFCDFRFKLNSNTK